MEYEHEHEWWTGKHLEGGARGLFQRTMPAFGWRYCRKQRDTPAEVQSQYRPKVSAERRCDTHLLENQFSFISGDYTYRYHHKTATRAEYSFDTVSRVSIYSRPRQHSKVTIGAGRAMTLSSHPIGLSVEDTTAIIWNPEHELLLL
jgi:hypothetical protein